MPNQSLNPNLPQTPHHHHQPLPPPPFFFFLSRARARERSTTAAAPLRSASLRPPPGRAPSPSPTQSATDSRPPPISRPPSTSPLFFPSGRPSPPDPTGDNPDLLRLSPLHRRTIPDPALHPRPHLPSPILQLRPILRPRPPPRSPIHLSAAGIRLRRSQHIVAPHRSSHSFHLASPAENNSRNRGGCCRRRSRDSGETSPSPLLPLRLPRPSIFLAFAVEPKVLSSHHIAAPRFSSRLRGSYYQWSGSII